MAWTSLYESCRSIQATDHFSSASKRAFDKTGNDETDPKAKHSKASDDLAKDGELYVKRNELKKRMSAILLPQLSVPKVGTTLKGDGIPVQGDYSR
jgi:hypothetical protein